ncbi:MAG: hypothetical protein ABJC61_08075 [Acidobacteriota bacterium]
MSRKHATLLVLTAALLAVSGDALRASGPGKTADPLAAEIDRWSAILAKSPAADEISADVKKNGGPALERARQALRDGRRFLALQRLASARLQIQAAEFLQGRPAAERKDVALFEGEWARVGKSIQADLAPVAPNRFDDVRPAAVRALAESTFGQVRPYYEASLDYGRSTMPDSGLLYLGTALSQRDFSAFCRTLPAVPRRSPPAVRSLAPELDALETRLLAAYRPPASIDRHVDFIVTSASLKDARELDAAGLRYGALLRYLQAVQRLGTLQPPEADRGALKSKLGEAAAKLDASPSDDSLARLFVEGAQADLEAEGSNGAAASAIVRDVLPLYAAALEPGAPRPPAAPAAVTVTLVRWPYT